MFALQSLPPVSPAWLFGAAMLVVGVVVALVSLRYVWWSLRVARARPVESPSAAPTGALVRVEGWAVEGVDDPLVAPFTGRSCLALRCAVEEWRPSHVLLPWWVELTGTVGAGRFGVRTAAASLPVDGPTASVVLAEETVATVAPDEDPPERAASFERRESIPGRTAWRRRSGPLGAVAGALGLGRRRYLEGRLEPGEDVTVIGRLTDGDGGGAVDPVVVSGLSPGRTLLRLARTSLVGLGVGAAGIALGLVVWAV